MGQVERESRDNEELRHVPDRVMTVPSAQERTNQVGANLIDCETNTADVEIRLSNEMVRMDLFQTHDQGIQVPSSSGDLSSHPHSSLVGPNMPNMMLQLDGPTSIHVQRKQPLPIT